MENRIEVRPGRFIRLATYEPSKSLGTIFLIHGLGGRADQWRDQIPVLKEHYTLIVPDLYGLNGSDAPKLETGKNPYSFAEMSADLEALFYRYKGTTNYLIGHSYGGTLATALCYNHQDRVKKLILLTPAPVYPNIQIPFVYKLPLPIVSLLRPLIEKQFNKLAFNQTQNPALIEYENKASKAHPLFVIKALISGMNTIPKLDMSKLQTPTLLIMGMNDKLVPPIQQESFYSRIPNLSLQKIPDAAHLVQLEKPIIINTAIQKFLED